jgi:hypothetical protein
VRVVALIITAPVADTLSVTAGDSGCEFTDCVVTGVISPISPDLLWLTSYSGLR